VTVPPSRAMDLQRKSILNSKRWPAWSATTSSAPATCLIRLPGGLEGQSTGGATAGVRPLFQLLFAELSPFPWCRRNPASHGAAGAPGQPLLAHYSHLRDN